MDRVYNSEKHRKGKKRKKDSSDDEEPPPKKRGQPKKVQESRYPKPMTITSSGDTEKTQEALKVELQKENPRKEVVLPLLKSGFEDRRNFVIQDAKSAKEILEVFPALKLSSVVSC